MTPSVTKTASTTPSVEMLNWLDAGALYPVSMQSSWGNLQGGPLLSGDSIHTYELVQL